MAKMAITYYFNLMGNPEYSNFQVHKSGKAAVETIISDSKYLFQMPVIFKHKPSIPSKGRFTIGFPFRQLVARFLTDDEAETYKRYGDKTIFDFDSQSLMPPKGGYSQ